MKNLWFRNMLDSIAVQGRELIGLDNAERSKQGIETLCSQLLAGRGEASGIALSQEILRRYSGLDDDSKLDFFHKLAMDFSPKFEPLQMAFSRYQKTLSAEDLIALNGAVEAPRQELFRRLNMAPHGTARLVSLRADLLAVVKRNPTLKSVDADLKHLFSSWFNRGFLQLHNIDWKSPAYILEKLINYESVHAIDGWQDLRRRLLKDRRCFAFFHPAMPDEPLIFIEAAFVKGLSCKISVLIDPQAPVLDPVLADTAIFYSINNTQKGLSGISFGNFLIKQVLTELSGDFPAVRVQSTLSPVPSFADALHRWLKEGGDQPQNSMFDRVVQSHHDALKLSKEQYDIDLLLSDKEVLQILLDHYLLETNTVVSNILADLALVQLTQANQQNRLADPVALFHLSNGARLERINTFADMSPRGLSISYGVMVNYLYDLKDVESNHESFVTEGKVRLSEALEKKLRQFKKTAEKSVLNQE